MQLTMGALLEAAYARLLERHGFERIETGQLVDTYARGQNSRTLVARPRSSVPVAQP